jgi:hypothetical protein
MKLFVSLLAPVLFVNAQSAEAGPKKTTASIAVGQLSKMSADEQAALVLDSLAQTVKDLLADNIDGKSKTREQIEHDRKTAACTITVFSSDSGEMHAKALAKFADTVSFKAKASPHMTLRAVLEQFVQYRCDADKLSTR